MMEYLTDYKNRNTITKKGGDKYVSNNKGNV